MSKPHQKRPKRRALRSAAQDRQRPKLRAQRKPAAIAPPVERGRLVVGGHDLGPAEFNPQTGVIEAGPHVAQRYATRGLADKIVENARIARPWARKVRDLARTDTRDFNEQEQKAHDHARRVLRAHVEHTSSTVRELAPPAPTKLLMKRD